VLGPGATVAEAQTLAASVERIDAAVLDLNLLGESSLPLAEALVGRDVPVVVVTGYDELPAEWERRVRISGFLRKPVDPGELQAALARATASESARGWERPGRGPRRLTPFVIRAAEPSDPARRSGRSWTARPGKP
jgi:DNA-binding NtrC family response regulator